MHSEVIYGPENLKSIDWFLVLPSVVVIFEVKSARFGILEKVGMTGFEKRSRSLIDRATLQLQRTSDAIDAGTPELSFRRLGRKQYQHQAVVTGKETPLSRLAAVNKLECVFPTPDVDRLAGRLEDGDRIVRVGLSNEFFEVWRV